MVVIEICIILLTLIAFGVGYLIYIFEFKNKPNYVERLNNLLDNSPYPIMFRTPKCDAYKKWHCHIANDANTGKKILIMDIDE